MADAECFIPKDKPVSYIGVFIKLYKWKNHAQVYEIHRMVKLKKMRTLTMENPRNLDVHQIIEISLILHSAYAVFKDQNKFVFYVNNYID